MVTLNVSCESLRHGRVGGNAAEEAPVLANNPTLSNSGSRASHSAPFYSHLDLCLKKRSAQDPVSSRDVNDQSGDIDQGCDEWSRGAGRVGPITSH